MTCYSTTYTGHIVTLWTFWECLVDLPLVVVAAVTIDGQVVQLWLGHKNGSDKTLWRHVEPKNTLTGHFIRYTFLVMGWSPFCLQNCLNYSWHRLNTVLKTFLRNVGPYWHDSITQLLQICRLHIHDANLPFHHIPKVLCWIEIWWLWRPFE